MQLTDFTSSGRRQCIKQEAQLPQRNSASAAHMEEGGPTAHPPTPHLALYMYMVESETRNKRTSTVPSTKRTLR